jgi:hypothetical protein
MNEPSIIDKLEKDPSETIEISPTQNKKTGLFLILLVIFLVFILPTFLIGFLYATGKLYINPNEGVQSTVDDEEETQNNSVFNTKSQLLLIKMQNELNLTSEIISGSIEWRIENLSEFITLSSSYQFTLQNQEYGMINLISNWLNTNQNFRDDIYNSADGPHSGIRGYIKENLACLLTITDENFSIQEDKRFLPGYEPDYTILVACGELPEGFDQLTESVENSELSRYTNENYNYSLNYPTDWNMSYTEGECPESLSQLVGCENPGLYEYVLSLEKNGYYFEIRKMVGSTNNSSYVVFPDSVFVENYQGAVGWNEYDGSVTLDPEVDGLFRRNSSWDESAYPGLGGFTVGYRGTDLTDSTNLYLTQMPFGSVHYTTPVNFDESILAEMDSIFESLKNLDN